MFNTCMQLYLVGLRDLVLVRAFISSHTVLCQSSEGSGKTALIYRCTKILRADPNQGLMVSCQIDFVYMSIGPNV